MSDVGLVTDLNQDGAGVVAGGGKTVFVAGSLPGEQVRYERRRKHRQYDEAALVEVVQSSPSRVAPRCAAFGTCGGCALQHMEPGAQLAAKHQQLVEQLRRIGKIEPREWFQPLAGPVWNYRRRARLGARYVARKGRSLVGFRERWSTYVTATERCEVLVEPLDALITPLSDLLTSLTIRERLPQIEVAVADNVIAMVLRVLEPPGEDDIGKLREFEAQYGVRFLLQPGGLATIAPLTPPLPELYYDLPDWQLRLQFLPTDFVQVNAGINRVLIARALQLLEPDAQARVLDLYCGLGNFTLPLARRAAQVVGVEGEAGLVARARGNAERNGIDNATFHVADLSAAPSPTLSWLQGGYSHVLIDPPRVGAREMLGTLAAVRPRRLVYVSCHPGSLARDLGILVHEHGFELLGAGVVDMFPHTAHVESIALLAPAGR